MLRKLRITLAFVSIVLLTLLFLDFTGTAHAWLGWMAEIQFMPAVLALNTGIIIALALITLLFGRVYCSVICPLGIMQDIFTRLGGRGKKKQMRFSYTPAKSWLRYSVLTVFIVACIAGIGSIMALLDPYGAYGRIAQNFLSPLWAWGNNVLAYMAERFDSYAFYEKEVWLRSMPVFIVAAVTLVFLAILAWKKGRAYCNGICPVGTTLGVLSRFSLFRIKIDTSKCVGCGVCARKCKTSCIDAKNHAIDYSRCVVCMDCIGNCKSHAISYGLKKATPAPQESEQKIADNSAQTVADNGRRHFMAGMGTILGAVAVNEQGKKVDGGLAEIIAKKESQRRTPIVPPGARSLAHMASHCTGCQLCVNACPNGVLRPSTDLLTFMQPYSSYERGYCRPECTKCSEVCPADAIMPISVADKSSIQIGHAVWMKELCLMTKGVKCGNCARHCPTGAISMRPTNADQPNSPLILIVDEERCIGCGACEHLCPVSPQSAIYVEGHEVHGTL